MMNYNKSGFKKKKKLVSFIVTYIFALDFVCSWKVERYLHCTWLNEGKCLSHAL